MQNLSKTAYQDLKIVKGDSFIYPFQYQIASNGEWLGVDLSEFDFARMQIRINNQLITEFNSTGSTNIIDISELNIGIIRINGNLPDEISSGEYEYDIELSNNIKVQTIGTGRLVVTDEKTF